MIERRRILRVEPLVLEMGPAHRQEHLVACLHPLPQVAGRLGIPGVVRRRGCRKAHLLTVAQTAAFATHQLIPGRGALPLPVQHLVAPGREILCLLRERLGKEYARAFLFLVTMVVEPNTAYGHLKWRRTRGGHYVNKL